MIYNYNDAIARLNNEVPIYEIHYSFSRSPDCDKLSM